jgi:hypothetical protein
MTKQYNQILMWIVNILFILAVGGCAAKKLVVNNADTLLQHQITKRLPLYTAQRSELTDDISKFLNKHKPLAQKALPVIDAVDLKEPQKVEEHYQELSHFYDKVSLNFSELLSKHMGQLDPKQQKDFFKTLDQENRDLKRKDPSDRMEKVQDRFETFFGSITENQRQALTELKTYFEERNKERIKRREELHGKFKEIFARDISAESRKNLFMDAFKEYQAKSVDHKKNIQMIKELLPSISKKQREFFKKRTEEVKEILKYFLDASY